MDHHKLNASEEKDHFPISFLDQILDYLVDKVLYYFHDGNLGYNQISITLED